MPTELLLQIRKRLLRPCERAKQALSFDLSTIIKVDKLIAGDAVFEDLDFELEIQRADYEEAASQIFARLEAPILKALTDADLDKHEVDEVILVGGSTRIPYVREWLKSYFSKDELTEKINPDEGVAYGAAMMAGILGA